MVIYRIKNKINGKIYIGQTSTTIKDRWSKHCNNGSHCAYLKNAINKYGKESFIIEEIYSAKDRQELNKLEKSAIKEYNSLYPNGYNLTTGGDAFNHSQITKDKISKAHSGSKRSKKARENMSKAAKGKTISDKQKIDIANTLKGNIPSNKGKGKAVRCLSNNKLYTCASKAAKDLNLRPSCVNRVASGDRKTVKGYRFKYE